MANGEGNVNKSRCLSDTAVSAVDLYLNTNNDCSRTPTEVPISLLLCVALTQAGTYCFVLVLADGTEYDLGDDECKDM